MDNKKYWYDGVRMGYGCWIDEPEQLVTPSPKECFEATKKKVNRKFIITATQPENHEIVEPKKIS